MNSMNTPFSFYSSWLDQSIGQEGEGAFVGFAKEEPIMRYLKSIFQAAVITGALALGTAAAQAMPLAQSPAPATVDIAKASNGITEVSRRSRWCYRHPRSCDRRYYGRRYYRNRNYYRPYYPRYYGYNRYYYPRHYGYGYPYYGYASPGVGLFFSF
jgi:hypothetical protein